MQRPLFLLLVLTFFSCQQKVEPTALSIAHPSLLPALPVLLMAETPGPVRLERRPFQDHALSMASFLRGEVDVLFTGTTLGASQRAKGVQLWRTVVWGSASILIRTEPSAGDALEQLAGKKVALPFAGSPNDIQMQRLSRKSKIRWQSVYQPHLQSVASLLAGQIHATVAPEPLASRLVAEGKAYRLAVLSDLEKKILPTEEAPAPLVSFFVKSDLSPAKRKALTLLDQKLKQALQQLKDDSGALAEKYAESYQVSAPVLSEGLKHTYFDLPETSLSHQRTRAFLQAAGLENPDDSFFLP